jgi:hypothetical protein
LASNEDGEFAGGRKPRRMAGQILQREKFHSKRSLCMSVATPSFLLAGQAIEAIDFREIR